MMNLKGSSKVHRQLRTEISCSSWRGTGSAALRSFLLLALAVAWQNASANWEFNPAVTVGATQTNNINLAVDSAAEDELVFEVSPSFNLTNDSKAWQVSVDYLMENLLYTRDNSGNETYHSLAATSVGHLIQDELTVAVTSRFYQQVIDPERSVRYSNISTSRNFSDSWVNSISPQWIRNVGSQYVTRLMYSYATTDYLDRADDGRLLSDVTTQMASAGFGSQRHAGRPTWDVAYSYQRAEPDFAREFEYEQLSATGEYPLSNAVALLGQAGAESDVVTDSSVAGLDEAFGEVGLRWIRNERTSIEAAVGHRSFGTTYRGSIGHKSKRLTLSAGYKEDVSTFALSQINAESVAFYDASDLGDPLRGIDDRVFVSKGFDASAAWAMPKGEVRLYGYQNRREFLNSGGDSSKLIGLSGDVIRHLGPRTDLSFNAVWYRDEPGGAEPDGFEQSILTVGLSRLIGKSLRATADLRQASRGADRDERKVDDTAASLFVTWTPERR